jgi:hypothetical protein
MLSPFFSSTPIISELELEYASVDGCDDLLLQGWCSEQTSQKKVQNKEGKEKKKKNWKWPNKKV